MKKKKDDDIEEKKTKILNYRRALRNTEKEIEIENLTKEELQEKKEFIKKLRNAISNIENSTFRNIEKGMYLGLGVNLIDPEENDIYPSYLNWEKITNHTCVLGASGVGKTILMLSNIKDTINNGWNTIVVDPKGGNGQEVTNAVLSFSKEKGILHNTHYLSPATPENSILINPNFGLKNVEIAVSIRDMMMGERTEQFYGDITYKTVYAILLSLSFLEYVNDPTGEIARKEIDEENKRHELYSKLINISSDINEANNAPEDGTIENIFKKNNELLEENTNIKSKRTLVTYRDLAKYVSHQKLEELRDIVESTFIDENIEDYKKIQKTKQEALAAINDTLNQEKDFFNKVSTSLSTLLTKLSIGEVGDIFCTIRTNPIVAKLAKKDGDQLVLIVQPFSMNFGEIANTVVKLILKQIGALLGNAASTERILNRIAFFIDEFGSVMYIGIEDLFNKARSLGGTLFVYTQSYQDFFDALGDKKGKIVLDSINTSIRMRMNNNESAEMVVKELDVYTEFTSTTVASTATNDSKVIIQKREENVLGVKDVTLMEIGRGIVKHDKNIKLVDFAHYGKIHSDIKFATNKYFEEIDRQAASF